MAIFHLRSERGALRLAVVALALGFALPGRAGVATAGEGPYEPTWESLRQYKEVPEWLRDGKFGIYTHWGPYAVHAHGRNTTWYSYHLYEFVAAFHHAANWFFFPVWDESYDTGDPEYSGLYGPPHAEDALRNRVFLDEWYGKVVEVIDKYSPDFIWFDFALDSIPEGYVKDLLAYYYNHATAKGKEVVVTYKSNDLVPGTGVRDLELGQEPRITYHEWITDSTVDDRGAWGFANDLAFKPPNRLIDNLVDRVSKNGYLLLNVGPRADGTIPEGARDLLLAMGRWLEVNGEAVYGTTPWFIAGEGPTNLGDADAIGFNESDVVYTDRDIRFTVKGDTLYATFLDWPGEEAVIRTLRAPGNRQVEEEDRLAPAPESLSLAGKSWTVGESTWAFEEDGRLTVKGGWAGEGRGVEYEQEETYVYVTAGPYSNVGSYDGQTLSLDANPSPRYPGFYKEEIERITMLGDGRELDWKMTRRGLVIETPDEKPCEHAFVLKIERHHHPRIR